LSYYPKTAILPLCSIYRHGSHDGWSAGSLDITFKGNPIRMIQAKFGLNWPSGFRGEDFWKSLQTDDGCQVMAIAHTGELKKYICYDRRQVMAIPHMTLWVRWAKNYRRTLWHNVISSTPAPWAEFKLPKLVVMGSDCTGSCKSNYHMITTTTAPPLRSVYGFSKKKTIA
jgi:hypothetical protein